MMRKLAILLATGFGLGHAPVASGTFGSLPGVLLVWLINSHWPWPGQLAAAAALLALAVLVCHVAEKHYGRKDDGRIVADEYMLLPIAFIGLPPTPLMLAVGFLVARFFDVLKPPPARGLQALRGGVGVVIDDFFASLYSLACNHVLFYFMMRM